MPCEECIKYVNEHKNCTIPGTSRVGLKITEGCYSEFPKCAFDDKGNFQKDNWNCRTMMKLRELTDYHGWNDDESINVVLMPNGRYLVMTYYKGRGKTGSAVVMCDDDEIRNLTLFEATELIEGGRK